MIRMKELIFAKSSSNPDSSYSVSFLVEDRKLSIHCSCDAGMRGQLCKHKLAFLRGDISMLADPREKSKLEKIVDLVKRTELTQLVESYFSKEKEAEKLKKQIADLKHGLARKMRDGVNAQ